VHTPLVYSPALSAAAGVPVYLKMETAQAAGSYKFRGHAHLLASASAADGATHFVCSSGGDAGAVVAAPAAALGVAASIYVPSTTPAYMRGRLSALGATVAVAGAV